MYIRKLPRALFLRQVMRGVDLISSEWIIFLMNQVVKINKTEIYGVHEYPPDSIFPKVYFTGINLTKLPIALIFMIPINHIT